MTNNERVPTSDPLDELVARAHHVGRYIPLEPPIDMPYDGNPEAYVDKIRNGTRSSQYPSEMFIKPWLHNRGNKVRLPRYEEARPLDPVLSQWQSEHRDTLEELRRTGSLSSQAFKAYYWPFMPNMLRTIANGARVLADIDITARRDRVLQSWPTEKRSLSLRVQAGLIKESDVEAAEKIIIGQPGKMKAPDFWRLPIERQDEIIAVIGRECLSFWRAASKYGAAQLIDMHQRIIPGSTRLLEEALRHSTRIGVAPQTAFMTFIQGDRVRFANLLRHLRESDEDKKHQEGAQLDQLVQILQPGQTLRISNEGRPIPHHDVRQTLSEVFLSIGEQLNTLTLDPSNTMLWRWNVAGYDPTEKFIGKHYGNITNLTVTRLTVDEDFARRAINEWNEDRAPLNTMRRILISADFMVGGRPIVTSLESYVAVRYDKALTPRICRGPVGKVEGAQLRQNLITAIGQCSEAYDWALKPRGTKKML